MLTLPWFTHPPQSLQNLAKCDFLLRSAASTLGQTPSWVRIQRCAMCICIHCHYVDRCLTYHAVETQHQQPNLTKTPDFEPQAPEINVNIRNHGTEMEWDVVGCASFQEDRNKWARLRPGELVPT